MNINELYFIADWFENNAIEISQKYQSLSQPMAKNIQQNSAKVALEAPINDLRTYLTNMQTSQLNTRQISILESLGVWKLLGDQGVSNLNKLIEQIKLDPVTASNSIESNIQKFAPAIDSLNAFNLGVDNLDLTPQELDIADGRPIVRLIFRGKASIETFSELKKSSSDIELIFRGFSQLLGEKVDDIEVIGTSKNSPLIFEAAMIAPVASAFAAATAYILATTLTTYKIRNEREKLVQNKLLTKKTRLTIAKELNDQIAEKNERCAQEILAEIKPKNAKPPEIEDFKKSLNRLIQLNDRGLMWDIVSPPQLEESVEEEGTIIAHEDPAIAEVRRLAVENYKLQQKLLLLEEHPDEAPD